MSNLALQGNMPKILALEKVLLTLEQVDCPVTHYLRSLYVHTGWHSLNRRYS